MTTDATPSHPQPTARPGRLVRNADARRIEPLYPASRLLKAAVFDAERIAAETRRVHDAAVADATATRQAAADEAAAVRAAAFERGAADAAAEFTALLTTLEAEIDRVKARFAADVQRVAFRFAKAVLDVEFQARPERVVQLVEQLLKPARLYHDVTIHLHPDDVERVRADQQRLAKSMAFVKELKFTADPKLPPHGVRVETEMGSYDGTIDTQIRRLQSHLLPNEPSFPAIPVPLHEPESA